MTRVLLQPRGSARCRGPQNFDLSIRRGLSLSRYSQRLPPADVTALQQIYLGAPMRLWGSTPTAQTDNDKARALRERRVGDLVLFYADKSFIARATIARLMHNEDLAGAVWGVEEETGHTWEHVMALTDVTYMSIPSERILSPLGMDPVVRGLTLLSTQHSEQVRTAIGLAPTSDIEPARPAPPATPNGGSVPPQPRDVSEASNLLRSLLGLPLPTIAQGKPNRILAVNYTRALVATETSPQGEPVPVSDVQEALDKLRAAGRVRVTPDQLGHRSSFIGAVLATLPGAVALTDPAWVELRSGPDDATAGAPDFAVLEGSAQVKVRREQALLRRLLLGGRARAECALCRREFPVDLLAAAHIKRRSLCTDQEKRDLVNIAMLACAFGCDRLFEDGYVAVDPQGIVIPAPGTEASAGAMKLYMERLDGERCVAFRPETAGYFQWHRDNIYRGNVPASAVVRT